MRANPALHVAFDVGGLVFAVFHAQVLGVDVAHGQLHDGKEPGGVGVRVGKCLVGHDLLLVGDEAVVFAIRQLGILPGLLAGQRDKGHLQPGHFLAGAQHAADPVGRPGVVEDGFALPPAGDGVGHEGGVSALHVGDGVAQPVGAELVLDDGFAAPAGVAAGQVGLAVAVGVEQAGDFEVFKLVDVGDAVLLDGFAIDQVGIRFSKPAVSMKMIQ